MIAVIDSGIANLTSVMAALNRLGAEAEVTTNLTIIKKADYIILPGVGAAAPAMSRLQRLQLVELLRSLTQPVLGICLGMQLLFEHSDESGGVSCLGLFPGKVKMLPASPETPVPHMGWNQLIFKQNNHPLLRNIPEGSYVYFVHSFAAPVTSQTVAGTLYGLEFMAMASVRNFMGCQFHPERSGKVGSQILGNFLRV